MIRARLFFNDIICLNFLSDAFLIQHVPIAVAVNLAFHPHVLLLKPAVVFLSHTKKHPCIFVRPLPFFPLRKWRSSTLYQTLIIMMSSFLWFALPCSACQHFVNVPGIFPWVAPHLLSKLLTLARMLNSPESSDALIIVWSWATNCW